MREPRAEMRVRIGTVDIAVDTVGSGPPVMVLHGFTGSARTMDPLVERLARHFRVVVPDLVGHARSSVPDDTEAYTIESHVRHVLAVGDVLGCTTFHLVGYSMGGRVALATACRVGHRLRSLTLIGATPGIADEGQRRQRRTVDEERARWIETDLPGFVEMWLSDPLFAGQARLGAEHLERARRQRLSQDPNGLAASLRGAGTGSMEPLHPQLSKCTMPTLLLAGGDDEKFVAIARDLDRWLPRASTAVIPGAGHAAHLERPDEVATPIIELVSTFEES